MQSLKAKVKDVVHKGKDSMVSHKKKTILITGGSGFVAGHILNAFLSNGYNVRATVRSQSSAEKVKKVHSQYNDQLSFAIVEDITKPNAFDEAVKGVDGVSSKEYLINYNDRGNKTNIQIIHTASPFVMEGIKDKVKELLDPAMKGTTEILKATMEHNPSVHRVVVLSSFAAMWNGSKGTWPDHTYTEADWNPVTFEEAAKPETDGAISYCASKTFAERAAWDFVEEKKPKFTLSTLLPPMVYGPSAHEPASVRELNTSSADIYRLCNGSMDEVPETTFYAFCDVRDLADAHVKAYEANNHGRFFIGAGNYTYGQVCDIIRNDFPHRKDLTPESSTGQSLPPVYKLDNTKAKTLLGVSFRDLKTSIHDMVVGFEEIEKRGGI